MWTHFWDMNSGGGKKNGKQHIFIEAPRAEAEVIFYNRFGSNPNRVSCTCCGADYSISEGELDQLTAYHRGCLYSMDEKKYIESQDPQSASYRKYVTPEEFRKDADSMFIEDGDIKKSERNGEVPEQGYVWKD